MNLQELERFYIKDEIAFRGREFTVINAIDEGFGNLCAQCVDSNRDPWEIQYREESDECTVIDEDGHLALTVAEENIVREET